MSVLSRRQGQTLRLIAEGQTDREIANILGIAEATASIHVRMVLEKLGARNRAHAVWLGVANGELVYDQGCSNSLSIRSI